MRDSVEDICVYFDSRLTTDGGRCCTSCSDEILLGTMQRTRCGDVKAMLIFGANEGILPLEANESQLF